MPKVKFPQIYSSIHDITTDKVHDSCKALPIPGDTNVTLSFNIFFSALIDNEHKLKTQNIQLILTYIEKSLQLK